MSKIIFDKKNKCKIVWLKHKFDEAVNLINLNVSLHTTYFDVCLPIYGWFSLKNP